MSHLFDNNDAAWDPSRHCPVDFDEVLKFGSSSDRFHLRHEWTPVTVASQAVSSNPLELRFLIKLLCQHCGASRWPQEG